MRLIALVLVGLVGCNTAAAKDKDCLRGSDGAEGLLDKLDKTIGDDPAELPALREHVSRRANSEVSERFTLPVSHKKAR